MSPGAEDPDDAALLRGVARGDDTALACLYDRHAGWLTVRLTRRCALPDVVDLAVQDTFLALWRDAGRYRGSGDVAAFIWGIGIRRLIDAIRRTGGGARRAAWRTAEPAVVVSAEDQVLAGIEHGRLGQALADLSPELRAAIEATVLDGLTCAEAAALLGVAEGTVKSRCHRAVGQPSVVFAGTTPLIVWNYPGEYSNSVSATGPQTTAAGYLLAQAMTRLPVAQVTSVLRAKWPTWLNGRTTDAELAAALGIPMPTVPTPHLPSGAELEAPRNPVCTS